MKRLYIIGYSDIAIAIVNSVDKGIEKVKEWNNTASISQELDATDMEEVDFIIPQTLLYMKWIDENNNLTSIKWWIKSAKAYID